jgi:hypothetical protein
MPLISASKFVVGVAELGIATSNGPTDVCKTPAPPAPVPPPIPYPNLSTTAPPGPGFMTKTLPLGAPGMNKSSQTALSNGDNAGVALGIVSGMVMGKAAMMMASTDVDGEGDGLARTMDATMGNG